MILGVRHTNHASLVLDNLRPDATGRATVIMENRPFNALPDLLVTVYGLERSRQVPKRLMPVGATRINPHRHTLPYVWYSRGIGVLGLR